MTIKHFPRNEEAIQKEREADITAEWPIMQSPTLNWLYHQPCMLSKSEANRQLLSLTSSYYDTTVRTIKSPAVTVRKDGFWRCRACSKKPPKRIAFLAELVGCERGSGWKLEDWPNE